MPQPLENKEIQSRLHDYARNNYVFLGNVTKGVVLAIATTVLLQIVSDFRVEWMRLVPWMASFVGIVVTYVTWDVGTILSNARANAFDSVLPLAMGVAEFLLFGILLNVSQTSLWRNWFFFAGTHAVVGAAIVHNRLRVTDFSTDFADPKISKIYNAWMLRCRNGASGVAAVSYAVWLCEKLWVPTGCKEIVQFAFGIPYTILMIGIVRDTTRMKRRVDEHSVIETSKAMGD
jgi:hypothetical protein